MTRSRLLARMTGEAICSDKAVLAATQQAEDGKLVEEPARIATPAAAGVYHLELPTKGHNLRRPLAQRQAGMLLRIAASTRSWHGLQALATTVHRQIDSDRIISRSRALAPGQTIGHTTTPTSLIFPAPPPLRSPTPTPAVGVTTTARIRLYPVMTTRGQP